MYSSSLQWRHNGHDIVSNHKPRHCLLNRLFGRRSKKTSKLRATGLWVGNSPGTGEFPVQMASNAENVSIWWRHHGVELIRGFALIIISYFRVASLPQCHEVYGHNWPATKIVQNVKWMHTNGNTCYLCAMLCGALTECGTCTRCNLQRNDFLPKINMAKEENIRIKADRLKKYQ